MYLSVTNLCYELREMYIAGEKSKSLDKFPGFPNFTLMLDNFETEMTVMASELQ